MFRGQLPRKPVCRPFFLRRVSRRLQSSSPSPLPPPNTRTRSRVTQILDRVPRPLRRYTEQLRHAPVTHLVAFLILHELTAIVPLVGLASLFHYSGWLPSSITESDKVTAAVQRFDSYFRRKGYFGFSEETPPLQTRTGQSASDLSGGQEQAVIGRHNWSPSEGGTRIVIEVAAAYVITKVLLPARLLFSVWATPWFAKVVLERTKMLGTLFRR